MEDNNEILNTIIKNDFTSFIHKVFNTINPGSDYQANWHINLIAEHLAAVERGEIKRLIINMPPRSLKSVCISVAWPAWLLGHNPENRIMAASYSQILSTKLSLDTRFVMNSAWYKKLFPKTILHSKQNQKNKFLTTKYGFRFATSVGGSMTGEGGDILIIDDPHNPTHISSEKAREKVINWYTETFSTRLNNRDNGKIVIVMQRLHEEDLTGFLTEGRKDDWHILQIPTIAPCDLKYKIGNFNHVFKNGETINPVLFSSENVEKLIREIGQHSFQAQYQQNPIKKTGSLFNPEYLSFYKELPKKFSAIIQSWDTAIKTTNESDYSACTTWGIADNKYYLISCLSHKYEYPQLKKQVESLHHQYLPNKLLIEDKASGQSLIQDLTFKGYKNIVACKPVFDKTTRFATCLDLFESGRVLFPADGYISHIAQQQLVNFPKAKNDDIVDSITQFLNYIKTSPNILGTQPRIRDL